MRVFYEALVLLQVPDVIAEMLRGEPGVFFQQTTPGQGVPIIRGLKGSQKLHMVDGMRLNTALLGPEKSWSPPLTNPVPLIIKL